jgi:hypothetical protein
MYASDFCRVQNVFSGQLNKSFRCNCEETMVSLPIKAIFESPTYSTILRFECISTNACGSVNCICRATVDAFPPVHVNEEGARTNTCHSCNNNYLYTPSLYMLHWPESWSQDTQEVYVPVDASFFRAHTPFGLLFRQSSLTAVVEFVEFTTVAASMISTAWASIPSLSREWSVQSFGHTAAKTNWGKIQELQQKQVHTNGAICSCKSRITITDSIFSSF